MLREDVGRWERNYRRLQAMHDCEKKDRSDAISLWHSANGVINGRDQEIAKHKETIRDLTQQKLAETRRADRAEKDAEKVGFALADCRKALAEQGNNRDSNHNNLQSRMDSVEAYLHSIEQCIGTASTDVGSIRKLIADPLLPVEPPF